MLLSSAPAPTRACDCQTIACDISCGCLNNCIMPFEEYFAPQEEKPADEPKQCDPKTPECRAEEKMEKHDEHTR